MATWNVRDRDPLLDSQSHEMLRQRGQEMLGLALIAAGVAVALMLGTYTPDDPGWMAASDAPVSNALGRVGASVAAPLVIIAGLGAWGLALAIIGWGLRFVLHRGAELFLQRVIFVPIAIALSSVWAATLVPSAGWGQTFGMGGIFGDTVLGALVSALPMAPGASVNLMAVLLLIAAVPFWAYVMGVVPAEIGRVGRLLVIGLVLLYAGLVALMRRGAHRGARLGAGAAQGLVAGAGAMAAHHRTRQEQRARHASVGSHGAPAQPALDPAPPSAHSSPSPAPSLRRAPPVIRATHPHHTAAAQGPAAWAAQGDPGDALVDTDGAVWTATPRAVHAAPEADDDTAPRQGLLARLKRLSLRPEPAPEPAAQHRAVPDTDGGEPEPGEDRVRARIADAVRARNRVTPRLRGVRRAPPVARHMAPPATPAPAPAAPHHPTPPAMASHARCHVEPAVQDPAPGLRAELSPTLLPGAGWLGMTLPFGGAPLAEPAPEPEPEPAPEPVPHLAQGPVAHPRGGAAQGAPLTAEPLFDPDAPVAVPPRSATGAAHVLHRRVVQPPAARAFVPSARAVSEAQPALAFAPEIPSYELPPLALLTSPDSVERCTLSDDALEENARMLETVLEDYGVRGEIVSVRPGPVVTMYELEPAPGLKASRVIGLADDIARSMSALSARVSTVPGRSVIGIELPNAHREKVVLREILAAREFGDSQMRLPLALGKDIGGGAVVANLAKMPHLLIAGTTGSGKSVAINTMILSLLYKLTPEECRLIMIDPKMLELSVYDGIPHLLSPVVTDPKKAVVALKWVVAEMEERYRKMSKMGVRNIEGYNGRVREALERGEMFKRTVQTGFDDDTGDPVFESEEFAPETLPYIVVIVDEMADLMMVAGKEIEACIQRLAQMARASGIHLIMATQRPSVDVITGTIKANFPTRISFQVTSKIDSRTILGEQGAEQLLGMGDMLYMAGGSRLTRVHGPFVSDEEVEEIVNHLKSFGPPDYVGGVVEGPEPDREADIDAVLGLGGNTDGEDALYDQAVAVVIKDRKCSTSYIQRKLGIGYNKAARLVEQMEDQGLVTPANHVGKREILVPEPE